MSDERQIRFNGRELGPYTVERLFRAVMSKEFDHTTEFFSERNKQWFPIVGLLEDYYPIAEKIERMREVGITSVKIVSGGDREDCPACRAIADRIYPIDHVPTLPPAGCMCVPWCCCIVLASPR
jgi:hypothetical protein